MKPEIIRLGTSDDPDAPDARMSLELFRPRQSGPELRTVLVLHGRNGAAHAPHMMKLIRPYLQRGYQAVAPNCCSSAWNDSAGTEADFSLAAHVRDASRACAWIRENLFERDRPAEGIALVGHSMGAYAAMRLAAEAPPGAFRHLLLVSPFVSGALQIKARLAADPDALAVLDRTLPRARTEWPLHDILPLAPSLRMPIALVGGALDPVAPVANLLALQDALADPLPLTMLPRASHCLEGGSYGPEISALIAALEASETCSA